MSDVLSYEFSRSRDTLGQRADFSDSSSLQLSIASITHDHSVPLSSPTSSSSSSPPLTPSSQWLPQQVTTSEFSCVPHVVCASVSTDRYSLESKSVSSVDGLWSVDVKSNDAMDKQRYVRRVMSEQNFAYQVALTTQKAEGIVSANNTIDLFENYFDQKYYNQNHSGNGSGSGGDNFGDSDIIIPFDDNNSTTNSLLRTVAVLRDPSAIPRPVTKICWTPTSDTSTTALSSASSASPSSSSPSFSSPLLSSPTRLAVSYSNLLFHNPDMLSSSYPLYSSIWDIHRPNHPEMFLHPPTETLSPIHCVSYNPRSGDILVGGNYNGQIHFWDVRKGSNPIESSPLNPYSSLASSSSSSPQGMLYHIENVVDIHWLASRTGNECCSVSQDGIMCWWDVRKLKKGPIDSFRIKLEGDKESQNNSTGSPNSAWEGVGCTSLDYKSDAGATRFLLGTESGHAMLIDRKAKADNENSLATKSVKQVYGRHYSPIISLHRSPYNLKYFLSTGDWCTKIFHEDIRTPIIATKYSASPLTSSCWSNSRPGVFYTSNKMGMLSIWDLMTSHNEAIKTYKITDHEITAMRLQGGGVGGMGGGGGSGASGSGGNSGNNHLAIGDSTGSIYIEKLSRSLVEMQKDEKSLIQSMLERETKKEKNLEIKNTQRKREAQREKERRDKGEIPANGNGKKEMPKLEVNLNAADLSKIQEEFELSIKEYEEAGNKKKSKGNGNGSGEKEKESLNGKIKKSTLMESHQEEENDNGEENGNGVEENGNE